MRQEIPLSRKKLFLLDMDGTVYLGNQLFPCTKPFLYEVKRNGANYVFLTNNSSKSASDYVAKLNQLGIPAERRDVFTSVEASAAYIKQNHPGRRVFASGTRAMVDELVEFGIDAASVLRGGESIVLQGFDTELDYSKVENACRLIDEGALFLACNIDKVCPVEDGYIPDCGSICEMITSATGKRAVFIGKPEASMISGLLKRSGIAAEEAVMVGDRLYTDIACGINAGVDTVLVLSGETRLSDLDGSGLEPTYVMRDVGELAAALRG
jgi:HAD superfamily hydrolase (TIGR01457 family)